MKLALITESGEPLILYKGVSKFGGLENWPAKRPGDVGKIIPGFLADWDLARVYSEPKLTGPADTPGMIAEFKINQAMIEDRTEAFVKWCDANNTSYDVSLGFPTEWREDKSVWTVCDSGSAHGDTKINMSCFSNASFVYAGIKLPYRVVEYYNNQEEWERNSKDFGL